MKINSKSKSDQVAILLLHGLGGGPTEMSYLKLYLEQNHVHVEVPLLPGHGTHYTDLKKVSAEDLFQSALSAFQNLKKNYTTVYVSGLCLGAVLALKIAITHADEVAGVIPISTTLFYDGWSLPMVARFPALIRFTPFYYFYEVEESFPFGVRDPSLRKWIMHAMSDTSTTHYSRVPYRSVWQMHLLAKFVRKNLHKIIKPVFAIHPNDDEVASLKSSYFIQDNLQKGLFRCLLLRNSFHLATLDAERQILAQELLEFCTQHASKIRAIA